MHRPHTSHILFRTQLEILMAKKLYVSNLAFEVTESDLSLLFGQCGTVSTATLIKDNHTGHSKGFGFVEMPNDDEAKHAIDRMHGYDLKGRTLSVEFAKDKPEGAVRGGGREFAGGDGGTRRPRGGGGGSQSRPQGRGPQGGGGQRGGGGGGQRGGRGR